MARSSPSTGSRLDAENAARVCGIDDIAEDDRAVAGHHNHPSTRNGSKGISLSFGPDGECAALSGVQMPRCKTLVMTLS